VALVLGDRFRLWSDPTDQAEYASFSVDKHWENYAIGSAEFERLIRVEYSARHSKEVGGVRVPGIINNTALNEMILTAKAEAWASKVEAVAVRRIGGGEGEVWLDLGRKDWALVRVTVAVVVVDPVLYIIPFRPPTDMTEPCPEVALPRFANILDRLVRRTQLLLRGLVPALVRRDQQRMRIALEHLLAFLNQLRGDHPI
jgi:hypothetical protein